MTIAASGMAAAEARLAASARKTADPSADPVVETLDQVEASMASRANSKVFQAANRNLASLVDILV